ncbi:MAG: ABC transporter permease [Ktedonobacteraceae bacterium]|nr:ABC transporter permease [Ktedonobacteraceae bacterium]
MAQAVNVARKLTNRWYLSKPVRQILFYIILILAWERLAQANIWPAYSFPSPTDVGASLISGFQDGSITAAILASLARLGIGYAISLVIGMTLGLLIGRSRIASETIGSLVLGLQALPSICWLPLAILWFGLTEQAIIFVVVMGALFSITLGVEAGVKNTPPLYLKAARNMGARGIALSTQVVLPAALPAVISGLKQGWSFAWRSLMAAELIYSTTGLGDQLENARNLADIATVVAVMLVIIAIGVIINGVIFAPAERQVRERWGLTE